MAFHTGLLGMGTSELKTGLAVVKNIIFPALGAMAGLTILIRVVLLRDESPVYIFMTVYTGLAQVSEDPLIFLQVAGKTRRRQVGAI